ncbi:MAG: tRNA pseudouridine(55) synthase TruB [Planctomycetes bacterium]|nr:tRNA pseudouridine(55) synthase TruB [Planctomycetota bacterium]
MNGILIINKEPGLTSHDVVDTLRNLSGTKRIGHTGTLDPMATGVLVTCFGQATRLIEFLPGDKEYQATFQLGVTSDTLDKTGRILTEHSLENITAERIRSVMAELVGVLEQIPPMFSAVKIKGKKLYQLARAGKTVARPTRRVTISELKINQIDLPLVTFTVRCSAGTYIRSLAASAGEKLGCGALLTELIRTQAGPFSIKDTVKLSDLSAGNLSQYLRPIDAGLNHLPAVILTANDVHKIKNGQSISVSKTFDQNELVRIYHDRVLLAIGQVQTTTKTFSLKPVKVLNID